MVSKKKNSLFVRGWDRKNCSEHPFVITRQASKVVMPNGDPGIDFIPCTPDKDIWDFTLG